MYKIRHVYFKVHTFAVYFILSDDAYLLLLWLSGDLAKRPRKRQLLPWGKKKSGQSKSYDLQFNN